MADLEKAIEEVEALVTTYADNTQYDAFRLILAANRKMRAALEPFAKAANNMDGDEPDSLFIYDSPESTMISYGDLRRARSALSTKEE
jgi:hypothetical protein